MIMALFLGSAYVLPSQGTAASLTEGFEGTFPPTGWLVINNDGGSYTWDQYSGYAHTGTYSAGCHYESNVSDDWLITPQLTSVGANDVLSFWYRVYSASYPESLEVRLSTTTNDISSFTTVLWAEDGLDNLTYLEKKINLGAYVGEDIYIAFVYKSQDEFYLYLDDVSVYEPAAHDYAVNEFIDFPSFFQSGNTYDIKAEVENKGGDESACDVKFFVDGSWQETQDVPLNAGEKDTVSFSWTPSVKSSGLFKATDFDLKIQSFLTGDADPTNDSVQTTVSVFPAGYTVEGFEDPTFPPEDWTEVGNGWTRNTARPRTGVASARCKYSSGSYWLITPKLEVSAKGDELRYWIRRYYSGYDDDWVFVEVSTGTSDTSDFVAVDSFHTDALTYDYVEKTVDLSGYAREKGVIYVAFHYQSTGGPYVYIDDVVLPPIYVPANDMATISIDNPTDGAELAGNSSVSVQATVKNVGINPQSDVPVHLEITDGGGKYTYKDTAYTGSLNQNDTEQITFDPDWTVPNVLAGYTIKVWTALAKADGNPDNDTVTISVSAIPEGYTVESFEGTTFPPEGWDRGPGTNEWARSSGSAHTGSYKARARDQNAWLFTPPLKVESGDALGFWYRAESSSHPTSFYVRLSTTPDQTDTLGYTTILADYQNITSTTYLEGNIDLSGYKGIVYIAFHRYYCDVDYYYLYLDDVALPPFPIQITVSPDSFYVQSFPDTSFDEYLYIGNLGGGQLDYDIELESAVGWLSVAPTSGSALGGEEDTITLSFNTAGLDGHYYNTLRIISNSDMKGVDTVLVPVHLYVALIPEISVSPDSFAVGVEGNGTLDTAMFISNTGNGDLDYTIETEEWGKFGAKYMGEPASRRHGEAFKSMIDEEPKKGMEDSRRGVPPEKGMGGPDAFGYRWIDSDEPGGPTYSWVEINSTGTQFDLSDDDNDGPYPIGFTFNFYGNDFDEFYICSNGWVSFTSTSTSLSNKSIPTTSEPNNLLALMWDDLKPATGGGEGYVYYEYDGLNRLIIEYDGVMRYGCSECLYTMEIILHSNGKIIYQYKTMGGDRLDEATIGIENEDGTDGLEVVYNADYVHDELAIRFSAAPAWLVFSPEFGTVPPSETDTIDVTFDATGILSGDFYGAFLISSNAPGKALDTVPAHMTILIPDMTFSPDSIATSCTEGQGVQHQTMNIGNDGDASLIFNIVEGASWLSISPEADTVDPGEAATSIDLSIDCTDLYAGNYLAELEVYSNDPDLQPYATYKVYLHVGPDPDIDVSPDSFYIGLYAGLTKDTSMTIANEGDGHLVWGIAIEEFSPPKSPDTLLSEGFEGGVVPPTGWSAIVTNPGYTWKLETYNPHSGSYYANCVYDPALVPQDEWLVSPSLNLKDPAVSGRVSFWWYMSYYWGVDPYNNYNLELWISTDGGATWPTRLWYEDTVGVFTTWEWYQTTVDIAKYREFGSVKLGWRYVGVDGAEAAVDDIVVEGFAPPWLTYTPETGVIEPNSSTDVTVSFSSIGVSEDKYANMWVTSNDPDEDPVLVPVHMALLGPEYSISPPETLVIEATEDALTDSHLYVSNFGGHAPLIFKMTDPVAWLSESPDSEDVAIDGTQDVTVTVDGYQLIAGDYETYIAIETNDFDEGYDTIVVIVHMGPDPCIAVDPESFDVQVSAGGTKDTTLTITNDCDGHLAFEISFEETGGPLLIGSPGGTYQDRILDEVQKRKAEGHYKSTVTGTGGARLIDKSNPAHLTALELGSPGMGGSLPGSPVMGKGDTVFIQLPHGPDDDWSFATSDNGPGYKVCENFWDVTLPISDIHWWGMALYYDGGFYNGDPADLVFDITLYSDPPGEIEVPTDVVCTYEDVVASYVFYDTYAGAYDCYYFSFDLPSNCNLSEGWVSIQSQSGGQGPGYTWLMWGSAQTGDGVSCQEGGDCPRYYDQAMILTGGVAWLTVSPEADTVDPHSSYVLDVHFDATEILGGEKFGNIIIDHNAPDKGTTIVPVHMVIGGAYYAIDPEELHMEVLEDWVTDSTLKVSNPGGEAALSYKMTCPVAWLTINPDTADVDPDQELSVSVRVNGTMLIAGDYYTEIAVKTNAVNQQYDTIPVFVHVGPDPDIDVVPMSLEVSVIPGCSMEKSVKMSNLGLGHLGFETIIESAGPLLVGVPQGPDQERIIDEILKRNAEDPSKSVAQGRSSSSLAPRTVKGAPAGAGVFAAPKGDIILAEGFEGGVIPPAGWSTIVNSSYTWEIDDYNPAEGYYYASCFYDPALVPQDEWVISPIIDLTKASESGQVSFYWMMSYYWSVDPYNNYNLELWISTDGGANFTAMLWSEDGVGVFESWTWYLAVVDLADYLTYNNVKLGWRYVGADGAQASIDDIIVETVPIACPFTVSPEADTLDPESSEDLILTFDGDAFPQCEDGVPPETLTCYLVISSNDPDEPVVSVEVDMWSGRGDVFDPYCLLDIGDVVFLVNYVLKGGPAPSPVCMGDCNPPYDGLVDVEDVMYLIQYLYQGGMPPLAAPEIGQPSTIKQQALPQTPLPTPKERK